MTTQTTVPSKNGNEENYASQVREAVKSSGVNASTALNGHLMKISVDRHLNDNEARENFWSSLLCNLANAKFAEIDFTVKGTKSVSKEGFWAGIFKSTKEEETAFKLKIEKIKKITHYIKDVAVYVIGHQTTVDLQLELINKKIKDVRVGPDSSDGDYNTFVFYIPKHCLTNISIAIF